MGSQLIFCQQAWSLQWGSESIETSVYRHKHSLRDLEQFCDPLDEIHVFEGTGFLIAQLWRIELEVTHKENSRNYTENDI
jgi:hypothetical protein